VFVYVGFASAATAWTSCASNRFQTNAALADDNTFTCASFPLIFTP